jgi:hypothetical protein
MELMTLSRSFHRQLHDGSNQGFDYGISTAIQQGVSTWHGALLNERSTWRPYGISLPFVF